MRIESFTVQGFANLVQPVTLGPLEDVNVLYGPNNAGKSNLLRALELYLRLLGTGELVTKAQPQILDKPDAALAELFASSFNRAEPQPVRFDVTWAVREADLTDAGLFPDHPCSRISTTLELRSMNRSVEMRVNKWALAEMDVATMDKSRDPTVVGFAQQIRRLLSDARPFQYDQPVLPYALLGEAGGGFPQSLRDGLFDARNSADPLQRRRWNLFAAVAGTLQEELGQGSWETTFERATGAADLVYMRGDEVLSLADMGAGVQRLAALLAELSLAQALYVCFEEPEWRLSPDLQARFVQLARRVIRERLGPRQLFLTTHSPILAALGTPFALERGEDGPVVEQKPWELAAGMAAPDPSADPDASLDALIGTVEELAEMDVTQVIGAPAGARPL